MLNVTDGKMITLDGRRGALRRRARVRSTSTTRGPLDFCAGVLHRGREAVWESPSGRAGPGRSAPDDWSRWSCPTWPCMEYEVEALGSRASDPR